MAEFCVTSTPVEHVGHQIHKTECKQVTDTTNMTYLGSFSSIISAFVKAKGLYEPVVYCSHCCKP